MAFLLIVILVIAAAMVVNVLFCGLAALPFAWAWNACLVPLFHLPSLSFTPAFALLFLLTTVFGLVQGTRISADLSRRNFGD